MRRDTLVLAFAFATVCGCSSDDGGGPGGDPAQATIASDGQGTVTSPSGASLSVPVGAVPRAADGAIGALAFTIAEDATPPSMSVPEGAELTGKVYKIGPGGYQLALPATVALPADDLELTGLALATYDESKSQWVRLPTLFDPVNNRCRPR